MSEFRNVPLDGSDAELRSFLYQHIEALNYVVSDLRRELDSLKKKEAVETVCKEKPQYFTIRGDIKNADDATEAGVYRMDGAPIIDGEKWYGLLVVFSDHTFPSKNSGFVQIASAHTGRIAMRCRWYEENPWGAWIQI